MHYVIYIPGRRGPQDDLLRQYGLFSHGGWEWWDCMSGGPDGGSGVMATVRPVTVPVEEHPEFGPNSHLTWTASCPGPQWKAGDYWFGLDPDRRPTPADLIAPTTISGPMVTLLDGNPWKIPEVLAIPQEVGRDPTTGELRRYCADDEYRQVCEMGAAFAAEICAQSATVQLMVEVAAREKGRQLGKEELQCLRAEFTLENTWAYAAKLLAINYRVGDWIMGHGFLGLVGEKECVQILRASISLSNILEIVDQKKSAPVSIPIM